MYNTQEIAERIKALLKAQGKSVSGMLGALGLGVNTISEFSKGKELSCISLAKIADYLGVSIDYLLGRDCDTYELNLNKSEARNIADIYEIMLSAKGLRILKDYIGRYLDDIDEGTRKRLEEDGIKYTDIKAFLASDNMSDNNVFAKLDKVLLALNTDIYSIFNEHFNRTERPSLADYGEIAAFGGKISRSADNVIIPQTTIPNTQ